MQKAAAHQQAKGQGDGSQRKNHIGGRIAQWADLVDDENLIDNIVERVDDGNQGTGNSVPTDGFTDIPCEQLTFF